ncbi:hypothetical protein COO03_04805 [Bacillus sp. AFS098217]|uniref:DUF3895 domain-containing protein n=1 Tax=Bacillus sp. AFS098217 TaxID=2033868 RepID=UPI000BEE354A|nr:DUF3895 domain-containing protein [Bacillus sp. AFS098217]PEB54564.1 hypothetical protein COO03_04805 [Bacillus sp. AFS098217]
MNQISFEDLFDEENKESTEIPAPCSPLQKDILDLISSGEISALQLCEKLILSGRIPNERYTTNKPKAYAQICSILEDFVSQGTLIFINDEEKKDRVYKKN